jgi:hypothetical protein
MKPHYYITKLTTPSHPNPEPPSLSNPYDTLADATRATERRAEDDPGASFEILKSVAFVRAPRAIAFWYDGEEPKPESARGCVCGFCDGFECN